MEEGSKYGQNGWNPGYRRGRLVLVIERQLTAATRLRLKELLGEMFWQEDVTMVSGLSRAGMLQAEGLGDGIFYNADEYISPEMAVRLLPWREVWLVAAGQVWRLDADA